ncbi:C40 family peptidase, partial [Akkermansiaceae bacterium]|nr:C40 family peptidase [Akkermansiaceae bacterium]
LQNKPYKWGGGHARLNDSGYDCSGAVSYVLREAGLMKGQMPSRGFLTYGNRGYGKWISIYARNGHVFMTIAGLRLDTGGSSRRTGPRWKPSARKSTGHVVRHPPGY